MWTLNFHRVWQPGRGFSSAAESTDRKTPAVPCGSEGSVARDSVDHALGGCSRDKPPKYPGADTRSSKYDDFNHEANTMPNTNTKGNNSLT